MKKIFLLGSLLVSYSAGSAFATEVTIHPGSSTTIRASHEVTVYCSGKSGDLSIEPMQFWTGCFS